MYDSTNGNELTTLALGGLSSGQPAMYELGGRQYLLVTASAAKGARRRIGTTSSNQRTDGADRLRAAGQQRIAVAALRHRAEYAGQALDRLLDPDQASRM